MHLFDTVSLVCGDSLGLKYCGENRDLYIYDNTNMRPGTTLMYYSPNIKAIVIESTNRNEVGNYNFILSVILFDYRKEINDDAFGKPDTDSIITSNFQLTVLDRCLSEHTSILTWELPDFTLKMWTSQKF